MANQIDFNTFDNQLTKWPERMVRTGHGILGILVLAGWGNQKVIGSYNCSQLVGRLAFVRSAILAFELPKEIYGAVTKDKQGNRRRLANLSSPHTRYTQTAARELALLMVHTFLFSSFLTNDLKLLPPNVFSNILEKAFPSCLAFALINLYSHKEGHKLGQDRVADRIALDLVGHLLPLCVGDSFNRGADLRPFLNVMTGVHGAYVLNPWSQSQ